MPHVAILAFILLVWPLASGAGAEPIPARTLFSDPLFMQPRISPDGAHIALLASRGDSQLLLARPAEGGKLKALAVFDDPEDRFRWLEWANDERVLVSSVSQSRLRVRGSRTRSLTLHGVNLDGSNPRELAGSDRVLHFLPEDPKHVLLQLGRTVKRLDVDRGKSGYVIGKLAKIGRWFANGAGEILVGVGGGVSSYAWYVKDGQAFDKVIEFDPYEEFGIRFAAYTDDPNEALVFAEHPDGDRWAVYRYDLAARELKGLVFAHDEYDVDRVIADRLTHLPLGVAYEAEAPEVFFLSLRYEALIDQLTALLPGRQVSLTSRSRDGDRAIVRASSDQHAPRYYAYLSNTEPPSLAPIIDVYPELRDDDLSAMRPFSYKARDGLRIPGYLTLPSGEAAEKLPLIVFPHGGPHARDVRGFDPVVQYLASRGYAVLQPNFRGSSGYGRRFRLAGYEQWGLAMQEDLEDGVAALIGKGIADPDRIGIYGSSYGGYAALMGLIKTPELYRAGASYAGVMDLKRALADDRWIYYRPEEFNGRSIGDPSTDATRLLATSPIWHASKIKAPVLLGHGTDDLIVQVEHSQEMAKALRRAGKQVEYHEYEHEVHGFEVPSNRIAFHEALGAFFDRHLAVRDAAGPTAAATAAAE